VIRISCILALCMILSLVAGCNVGSVFITEKDELLFNKIDELYEQIEDAEWDEAFANMNDFKQEYEQRRWKLMLLGELDDYKQIELEMERFKESVEDEDEYESKVGLREIKYRLFIIFHHL
jgi:hypothetical protein